MNESELPNPSPKAGDDENGNDVPALPQIPQWFAVNDTSSANWVLRKIAESRAYAENVQSWAAAEIRRAENEERFLMQRFGAQLESWARQHLQDTGSRRRSIPLPSGTIGFRSAASRLEIADQTALLNWCRANLTAAVVVELKASGADALNLSAWRTTHCPSAVATESVMKSVVDAHFHTTGECPAGTQNVVGEKFFIR
ncbi:MAG TPA: host-nuclease inhibitor Gam family protein [Tepidisphaeraceae bacterium]|jgi:hypothetical protein